MVIIMSFDGIFLHKLIDEFNILKTGRITKIIESGDTDFIFQVRANHQNYNLMICLSSDFARIHLTQRKYEAPATPKAFTLFLRKQIEGFFINNIYQHNNDRIVILKLEGYNEMKDFQTRYLFCEIMGRYSNLILTDENYKILEVLKKDGISEFNRTMLVNATYQFPVSNKINPYNLKEPITIESPKDMLNKFEGISMLLAVNCFKNDNLIDNLMAFINSESKPCIIKNDKNKNDFYFLPFNYEIVKQYSTLSSLLDEYYYEADNQAKIKLKTNDLLTFVHRQLNKNRNKIIKLNSDLREATDNEELRLKGELLLSYPNLKEKHKNVTIFNYYTNEYINIELDAKYDIITNSQKFYKKYQKSKSAIHYLNEQINIANNEIEYFEMLDFQLKNCTINDALEIQQELIENKYLFKNTIKNSKKHKPNFVTYVIDNTEVTVGKNNVQNEYITHKLAKPNFYWLHVKDASGSHVIIHSDNLSEELLRTSAMLAAYNSALKDSSSIPVDYTQVKNIKKIPGKKACFVTYSKQKTIYIDINEEIIKNLRIKR